MLIIGRGNQKVVPFGYLQGPGGRIPITSFSGSFAVGSIPTCLVGVPIEMLGQIEDEQSDQIYEVFIGEKDGEMSLVFRGYISGDNSDTSGNQVSAGIALVHIARDLDQHRISAPDLHPSSVNDFTYTFLGDGFSDKAAKNGYRFGTNYFKEKGGRLPDQIIKGLIGNIERTASLRKGVGAKLETASKAVELLKTIRSLNGEIRGEISGPLSSDADNTINQFIRKMAEASFTSKRSVWDTLTTIFSQFGLHLICNHDGQIYVGADVAGFAPAQGNILNGNYMTVHQKASVFQRNIKEVNVIGSRVKFSTLQGDGTEGTIVTYPPSSTTPGASMAILLPGWLSPISLNIQGEPASASNPTSRAIPKEDKRILGVQINFAKMMYFLERNKLRTMSVTGPFAPRVTPGTTALIAPFSAMKPKSGSGSLQESLTNYSGFCYQVNHQMDAQAKTLQTSFIFRNVSRLSNREVVEEHPLFNDVKPFAWQ